MLKSLAPTISLLSVALAASGATFTNSGTADWVCFDVNRRPEGVFQHATGTSLVLSCPPGLINPTSGHASVGDLSAEAFLGYGPNFPRFSLQSTFTDTLLPVGGTGPGMVEFTLTYQWAGLNDLGSVNGSADLLFNGVQAAAIQKFFCFTPPGTGCPYRGQTFVNIVDEPVTYGTPFSYQADDFLTAGAEGVGVSNQLTVSTSLITGGELLELPEPASFWLCGIASLALLFRAVRRLRT